MPSNFHLFHYFKTHTHTQNQKITHVRCSRFYSALNEIHRIHFSFVLILTLSVSLFLVFVWVYLCVCFFPFQRFEMCIVWLCFRRGEQFHYAEIFGSLVHQNETKPRKNNEIQCRSQFPPYAMNINMNFVVVIVVVSIVNTHIKSAICNEN